MNSGKPELAGAEFEAAHISRMLLHVPSGRYYVISQGLHETDYETFDAFLIDRSGDVVFLEEPASGPKTRAELDELRAGTR